LRKHKKKHVFDTYAFPSTMVMGAGNLIAFPCHFGIFMRIHMCVPLCLWKHIPNVEIFDHHVRRCGNTSLTHTRLQSLFISLCENPYVFTCPGNVYVFTCPGNVKSRNTCAFLVFFSKQQETRARSTPSFSHLLLNNKKRQDLKSCSVAACAITFQLQPCFP